jgi:hypothetical protein
MALLVHRIHWLSAHWPIVSYQPGYQLKQVSRPMRHNMVLALKIWNDQNVNRSASAEITATLISQQKIRNTFYIRIHYNMFAYC